MQEISFRDDILPLKDKLFRLALRITFNRAEAEDVVQETLIRVWNKRDEWTQFGSVEAKEIAVVLSLTEEQVKVNLFRARQKVKQRFIDIEGYGL